MIKQQAVIAEQEEQLLLQKAEIERSKTTQQELRDAEAKMTSIAEETNVSVANAKQKLIDLPKQHKQQQEDAYPTPNPSPSHSVARLRSISRVVRTFRVRDAAICSGLRETARQNELREQKNPGENLYLSAALSWKRLVFTALR